ncbi:pentatricopeptide repeat-containing protein At1g07590, mitochondrial-like [Carex rostrata]
MQSLLRLLNTQTRINTARNGGLSFLASCTTLPASLFQSDPQCDHFASDPKSRSPSVHGLEHNMLTSRLEKLPPGEAIVPVLKGWMRDGFAVDRNSIFQVLICLRGRHLHSCALEVMEWVVRERPYKLTEHDYSYLLECTSKCHGIARAEKLFQTIPKLYQNEFLYNELVMYCLADRNIELSHRYMKKMRKMSLPISPSVYNSLIALHLAPSRRENIPDILTQMKADGVKPHIHTFNILLNIHAEKHDIDELSKLFDEMQTADVEPNENTYCILAKAYAMARLYTVAESYVKDLERLKTEYNLVSLNALVMLYGCLNKVKELDLTWKSVQQLPCVDPDSYLLAIEAFGKVGLVSSAEEIWAKLRRFKKIDQPNQFNSILSVYCRYGIIEKAIGIRKEMDSNNCKPNAITYRHLTLGYLKAGQVTDAIKTLKDSKWTPLTKRNMQSTAWLESTLMVVEMFGHSGILDYAEFVFKELKRSKYSRHTFVFNALLKGYVTARVYRHEDDVLEWMISDGAKPDAETYRLLKLISGGNATSNALMFHQWNSTDGT